MKSVEDLLQRMALKAPSEEFQTRIDSVFREAAARPPSWRNRPVPLWKCVVACGLCALIAFASALATVLPYALSSHRDTIVYLIPHQGPAERNAFDVIQNETVRPLESKPWTVWRGEVRFDEASDTPS